MPPSDTYFTLAPHWGWLIVLYFFFGGISAGAFVFSAILDLFGKASDRALARIGYFISFPALLVCPPLLILDLNRPERFWHMLIQNNTGGLMLKWWSPISIGAWALFIFGIFVTAAFLGALAETDRRFRAFSFLSGGALAKLIAAVGAVPGFFIAGYTGVLLSVTNRPIWADSSLIGLLFLLSGATAAAALMIWLGRDRATASSLAWLGRVEAWIAIFELVVIIALVVTLGPVIQAWMNIWGLLLLGVVLFGILLPIFLHYRPRVAGSGALLLVPALVVFGSFLLRVVVILSSEAI